MKEKTKKELMTELGEVQAELARLRQQAAGSAREETKFFSLLESAPDAIVIINSAGTIELVNSQAEKLFGYKRDELIGQQLEILVPERYRSDHVVHRDNYFTNPRTRPMGAGLALAARRKDASEVPVEISLSPLQTPAGMLVTSIIRDVTERRRAEEALRRSRDELERRVSERTQELTRANEYLQQQIAERQRAESQIREQAALLDKTQDAILVRSLEDQILFWNKGAERLYGWSREEALGRNANELLHTDLSPNLGSAQSAVMERGEWVGELQQMAKDGREITVESRWTLVRDDLGNPKSKLIINTDITEKKRLATQFLRAQRLESIGTLAAGIAHDLNNALTPIIMSIRMLQMRFDDEESRFLLNTIAAGAERGADMIKQVLSFARGFEGERVLLQPRHLINDIRKILRQTFPKSIDIETLVPNELWAVAGDATQLYQVIMNLAVNARDAMPEGGRLSLKAENITLDENFTRMHIEAKPGAYIRITVADTGKGIPATMLDKVFEPFFTTKEIGKGTGLGLSTALGIVKSHDGFIDVNSEPGRGTQFKIYLPAITGRTSVPTDEEAISKLPAGNGEMIMVVDDELGIREITRATLAANGYKVLVAGDGTEALALYAQHIGKVDLVLIDMMMPYLDGPATIRALEKLDPDVAVIATSGLISEAKATAAQSASVKAFLPKPYTADQLLEVIANAITKKG